MSTTPLTPLADDQATVTIRYCPRCKTANRLDDLTRSEYRCGSCGFEMAYLDVSTVGVIRGVLGWVRREGEVIEKRYSVAQLLGRGGFGSTYLVEDLQLNRRRRALKEIPMNLFNEAEMSLLARLDHPAIPDIIDRLYTENMAYLVLKFGGTRTLGSERKRLGGRIPFPTLVPWIYQLCRVLCYLHAQNPPIIHRDLKPDNLLLDEQDNVMLIDFGIAKEANPSEATRTLGRAVSFGFSPPEQIMGTGTDPRSDIYSLGATVYFLLTGSHPTPFDAQLAGKKVQPLASLVPGIPPALDQAILKALEVDPARRQQSVQEMLGVFEELERTAPGKSARQITPTSHGRKNLLILVVLFLGLAAVIGGGILLWRLFSGPEAPQKTTPGLEDARPAPPAPPVGTTPPMAPPAVSPEPPARSAPPAAQKPPAAPPSEPEPKPSPPAPEVPAAEKPAEPASIPSSPEIEIPVRPEAPKPERPRERPARSGSAPAKPASAQPAARPKPKPAPPRTTGAKRSAPPKPAAPDVDWSGSMIRGQTHKTTP